METEIMSNLNLPTMTFDALTTNNGHTLRAAYLAYVTTAQLIPRDGSTDAYVIIRHHGTVIAEIARGWVFVTNAGYDSHTTRDRIHKILTDNRQDYGFLVLGQIEGGQVLSFREFENGIIISLKDRVLTRSFYSAHWDFENREVSIQGSTVIL